MNTATRTALLALVLAACGDPVGPAAFGPDPVAVEPMPAPAVAATAWAYLADCTHTLPPLTLADVRWFRVAAPSFACGPYPHVDGCAIRPDRIYLSTAATSQLMLHELLHLWLPDDQGHQDPAWVICAVPSPPAVWP